MRDDEFEWDNRKAARNLTQHGVSFEAARLAFDDAFGVAREDLRQHYGEDRYNLLGIVQGRPPLACDLYLQRGAHPNCLGPRSRIP